MTSKQLGRLERVDLRQDRLSKWSDFTPWFSQPNNLTILIANRSVLLPNLMSGEIRVRDAEKEAEAIV